MVEECTSANLTQREDWHIKNTPLCLNTCEGAVTGVFSTGPSETKKAAAVKRWQRPDYQAKRAKQMANRDAHGRLMPN
jgi:hypothetical protein